MNPSAVLSAVTVLTVLASAPAAPAATGPLVVGSLSAAPGQAVSGFLDVPAGIDPGTRIPVTVVHGLKPGPVLALVAGTHGYEYTSILALARIRPRLDPKRMTGSVILVHMANPATFYGRRIYYGPDGKNLNRVYPGKVDGTQSERIADVLTREVIDRATHLADLHCGDGNESLRPYAYWLISGNAPLDEASKGLVLAFGLDHVVIDRERPTDKAKSLYTDNTAILRGKPAFTAESGGMGLTDEASVGAQERGVMSLLAHLGILEAPSVRVEKPVFFDRAEVLRAGKTGVWQPAVEKMQSVAAGTLLGRVHDPFGAVIEEVRSPFAGEILYVVGTPPVSEGEPLAFVGHLLEGDPKP